MTDNNNLPATAETGTAVSTETETTMDMGQIWQSMMQMAKDPSVDAAKLGHIMQMQKDMKNDMAKERFDRAFAMACRDMPVITKDDKIEHNGKFIGWFKKYEDLRSIVDPIIRAYGLTITHDSEEIDGGKAGLTIWTNITYVDDQFTHTEVRGRMPVPPDAGGAKSAAQALGSAQTYGQRYSLVAAFGIIQKGLDRDGRSPGVGQLAAPSQEQPLIDAGQRAAAGGAKEYTRWLNSLTNAQKGWLVTNDHHDKLIKAARDIDAEQQ